MKTETEQSYHTTIVVNSSVKDAFEKISNVSGWWALNFEGSAKKPGDTFTVHFGETWVTFEISEVIPDKKIAWHVIDCYLPWLNDKTEWTGTTVVFEAGEKDGAVVIDVTHYGLVPSVECYEGCEKGWNFHINESLVKYINEGKGAPIAGGSKDRQQ